MGSLCGPHKYYEVSWTRFYCVYGDKEYYLACRKFYEEDKLDEDSILLIVHTNWKFHGMNFKIKPYKNGICLSYIDDADGLKNWNLAIKDGKPVFHRYSISDFVFEPFDGFIKIKDINSNSYLYMDTSKERDNNSYGRSFYVGVTKDRNKATRFKRIDK